MKIQPIFTFMFVSMLISCTSAPTQPNMAATSDTTATLSPTNALPSTQTPSPTIDPNAPVEYSRFEDDIYFLDKTTKTGNTLIYTWNKERKVWERQYFYGPVWARYPEQIQKGAHHQLYMTVIIDETLEKDGVLPIITPHENTDPIDTLNWSGHFRDIIIGKMANAGMFADPQNMVMSPWFDGSHKFHFDFNNADGQQQWGLWDGSTITVYIQGDYESLKNGMGTNGFSEAKGIPLYGKDISYMVKLWTQDGNLNINIAPTFMPTNEKQIMEILMFGPAAVMESATYLKDSTNTEEVANLPDLSEPQSGNTLSSFVLNQGSFRLFDIEPSQ